jgi:NCS1 family nucleobase:cation symporter-1
LFVWAWVEVGDIGAMVSSPAKEGGPSTMTALATGITGAVAFWGTLALNIPDFTRYAASQKDQAVGQAISLPTTMTFYVFIGAAVTNATMLIFGEQIADPVEVLARAGGPFVVVIAMFGLIIATLSTNLAANVVSPANGFSNLLPSKIDFKRGAVITALIGLVIMPWKMWEDPAKYIVTWLGGCGSLLGAVGGIMIADYFVLRKTELDVEELYRRNGIYTFQRGWNPIAVIAFGVAVAVLLPGFLASIGAAEPATFFLKLYEWSWFVAFAVAGAIYWAGMTLTGSAQVPTTSNRKAPSHG